MKNQFIIPSIIIAAAILGGFWMLKPPSEPLKVIVSQPPSIAIHDAAKDGNIEIVKRHLAAGTGVNDKDISGQTPLMLAAEGGSIIVSQLLISKGADVNAKDDHGRPALHYADLKNSELLIANGADVDAKDDYGRTALHLVAYKRHNEIAKLLVDNGADVNAKDNKGLTPLDHAASRGNIRIHYIADLLQKHGGKTKLQLKAEGK